MLKILGRSVAFFLVYLFVTSPLWATCGGGGGGGGGGMSGNSGNGGSDPTVYHVPWRADKTRPTAGLILYWFPMSNDEVKRSSLLESRDLAMYASQCIAMELADTHNPDADKLLGDSKLPVVVLANPDDTPISKVENTNGKLKVADVEKLVGAEVKTRGAKMDDSLAQAKSKADAGDKPAAITLYQSVVAEKCMFPKQAKDATRELKRLGATDISEMTMPVPKMDAATTRSMVRTMKAGLVAENKAEYMLADRLYSRAHSIDPADPTPLRYLAELNRHDIGDWDKAKAEFHQILDMPADPLSRAVALHGLGKITIHEGEFKKGLQMMEESVATYPLALAYRNLAVYWNSEGDLAKGSDYTQKALAMDPKDPYNLVFAAVFMAANGQKDEALKIAMANINLMPASYNLAAIFAQNGQKAKALELLRRHFYQYERYQEVRTKEMMEARVDFMFNSIRRDSDFLALTKFADGRLPMVMSPKQQTDLMNMNQ